MSSWRFARLFTLTWLAAWPAMAQPLPMEPHRVFVEFAFDATTAEMDAAERWGAKHFAKAKSGGRPVRVSVARNDATTLMSLESTAICERAKGCPLLVFRDVAKQPVLDTWAFQNVVLDYREKGTYLSFRVWDKTTECLITTPGRARCKDAPPRPKPPSGVPFGMIGTQAGPEARG